MKLCRYSGVNYGREVVTYARDDAVALRRIHDWPATAQHSTRLFSECESTWECNTNALT